MKSHKYMPPLYSYIQLSNIKIKIQEISLCQCYDLVMPKGNGRRNINV